MVWVRIRVRVRVRVGIHFYVETGPQVEPGGITKKVILMTFNPMTGHRDWKFKYLLAYGRK
eukprot:scaffold32412_cov59-Attheya_sp.AAC.5